jgi:glucose/arabinose dehydrogenase
MTMNQRDDLGSSTPGDWLALVRQGESWGFPGCYGQGGSVCAGVPQPIAVLDTHAAVAGVAVLPAALAPSGGSVAAVAEWARDTVLTVPLHAASDGYTGTPTPWLTGLSMPVPVVDGPDGAVYIGAWGDGTVVRVSG